MSADSEVRRLRSELVRLREQIGRESSTVASKRKYAADAKAAASRSKSPSMIQSKLRDADRYELAAVAAEKKRAELERKAATKEKALDTAQGKKEKELAAAQKKSIDGLKKQAAQAAQRFNTSPALPARTFGASPETSEYDVFLSHASEDKDEIARPLADALTARGVTVWFDELNIRVGQSIRREIERGIRDARFGLVIVSPNFMAKQWTQTELDALWGKKLATQDDSLLPVWHKVTVDEVRQGLPLLSGLHALNTSTMSVGMIADLLAKAIKE